MIFRQSEVSDLSRIMEMIIDAKKTMQDTGIDQWQGEVGSPDEELLRNDIENKASYVVTDEDEKVIGHGSITFDHEKVYEKIYDGQWQSEEPYGSLHRIVTSSNSKRKGVAVFIVKELEKIAIKNGKPYIRCITHEDNTPVQSMLNKLTYKQSGIIYNLPNFQCKRIAFDKKL